MSNSVTLGYEYFPDPAKGRPVFNGSIYIGEPDTDPTLAINQKAISVIQEDGTVVPVSQPVLTGSGGIPLYNGSPVSIVTDGNYSLAVLNALGSQVYYLSEGFVNGVPITSDTLFDLTDGRYSIRQDTVSEMVLNADLTVGDFVKTAGYISQGDGGDNLYEIVAAGTGVDDGGLFIDLSGISGQAKGLFPGGIANNKQFGAASDGVTDDVINNQAALDSGFSSVMLLGNSLITSTLTVPLGVTLFGGNRNKDGLVVSGSGYDAVILGGNYASVDSIGFSSASERASGSYININGLYRGNNITNFLMSNGFVGIRISTNAVITNINNGEILDCKDGAGTGILIEGGNDTFISNVIMDSTGTEPLSGIRIKSSQAVWITDTDVIDFGTPLIIDPDGSNGDLVTWCFFNGVALDTSDGNGIQVAPTNGATVKGLFFDNCWSATNARGVLIQPTAGGIVDTVHFTDCTLYNNQLHGALIDNAGGPVNHIEFNNCRASGNSQASSGTYAGIDFGNGSNNFAIRGCTSGAQAGFPASQSYGILIGTSCSLYLVTSNSLIGNSIGAYADLSFTTTPSKVVSDNLGFLTSDSGQAGFTAATSVVVNHGLLSTPDAVQVTPLNTNVAGIDYWVSTLTSTTFTINASAPLSGAFSWTAEM